MKILSKKYIKIILTLFLAALSVYSYAVFEGRDESLQQYSGIRSGVEIEQIQTQKATAGSGYYGGYDEDPETSKANLYTGALSDSPLFFLLLGGIGCGAYLFVRKRKPGNA